MAKVKGYTPAEIRNRTIMDTAIVFFAGVVYYFVLKYTHFSFKCYIHEIFGVQCSTCGMTRMMQSAVKLDFKRAFEYNRFLFITFPYIVYEVIYFFYLNESKKKINKTNEIILFIYLGLLVIYGILRNIFPI